MKNGKEGCEYLPSETFLMLTTFALVIDEHG